jgi:hypothetical protein
VIEERIHRQKQSRNQYENWKQSLIRQGYSELDIEPYKTKEVLTAAENSIKYFEFYGLHRVKAYDIFEYGMARYDKMIDEGCRHLINKDAKEAL